MDILDKGLIHVPGRTGQHLIILLRMANNLKLINCLCGIFHFGPQLTVGNCRCRKQNCGWWVGTTVVC